MPPDTRERVSDRGGRQREPVERRSADDFLPRDKQWCPWMGDKNRLRQLGRAVCAAKGTQLRILFRFAFPGDLFFERAPLNLPSLPLVNELLLPLEGPVIEVESPVEEVSLSVRSLTN
jgi:hypothetical protein